MLFLIGAVVVAALAVLYWILNVKCKHKYELIEQIEVYDRYGGRYPIYRKYVSRCPTCGHIKIVKG